MKNFLQKTRLQTSQKIAIFTLALCLFLSANVSATTITSAGSGVWSDGSTWVGGIVPSEGDDVVIESGHSISLLLSVICNSMVVNGSSPSGLTSTNAVNITTTLTVNNTFFTNTGPIIVNGLTTISTGATWQITGQFSSLANVIINGQLKGTTTAGTTVQTWVVRGTDPTIEVNGAGTDGNGTLGATGVGLAGESIRIFLGHSGTATFKTMSGTPVVNLARMHTNLDNSIDQTTVLDVNMNFNSSTNAANALSLQQGNNGTGIKKMTIKAGRTIVLTNSNCSFHSATGSTQTPTVPQGNMTYDIESGATLDVTLGRIYLYTTTATPSTQAITINVKSGGTLKTGTTFNLVRKQLSQTINVNVAAGGVIDGSITPLGTLTNSNLGAFYSWFTLAPGAIFRRQLSGGTNALFPIGYTAQVPNDSTGYNPIFIKSGLPNPTGVTSVVQVGIAAGNAPGSSIDASKSVNVTWDIKPAAGSALTSATITFGYNLAQVGGSYNDAAPLLTRYTGSMWEYVAVGGAGATSAGVGGIQKQVVFTAVAPSSFTTFGVSNANSIPIELQSLTAKPNGASNLVTWTTASEKNNVEFQIERSNNGTNFTSIGTVKGSGSTNSIRYYDFNDEGPLSINYYRLRQIDLNGTSTVSKVVSVVREKGSSVRFYPSVTGGELTVEVPNNAPISLSISDLTGRIVMTKMVTGTEKIDVSNLSNGTYFLTLTNAGIRTTEKFVKQ